MRTPPFVLVVDRVISGTRRNELRVKIANCSEHGAKFVSVVQRRRRNRWKMALCPHQLFGTNHACPLPGYFLREFPIQK